MRNNVRNISPSLNIQFIFTFIGIRSRLGRARSLRNDAQTFLFLLLLLPLDFLGGLATEEHSKALLALGRHEALLLGRLHLGL